MVFTETGQLASTGHYPQLHTLVSQTPWPLSFYASLLATNTIKRIEAFLLQQ